MCVGGVGVVLFEHNLVGLSAGLIATEHSSQSERAPEQRGLASHILFSERSLDTQWQTTVVAWNSG